MPLTQEVVERRKSLIAYTSNKMTPAGESYRTNNKQLLALVYKLHRFRGYLEGGSCSVITDDQTTRQFFSKIDQNRRETGWFETLAEFNFSILKLKPEKTYILVDALSRVAVHQKFEYENIAVP